MCARLQCRYIKSASCYNIFFLWCDNYLSVWCFNRFNGWCKKPKSSVLFESTRKKLLQFFGIRVFSVTRRGFPIPRHCQIVDDIPYRIVHQFKVLWTEYIRTAKNEYVAICVVAPPCIYLNKGEMQCSDIRPWWLNSLFPVLSSSKVDEGGRLFLLSMNLIKIPWISLYRAMNFI